MSNGDGKRAKDKWDKIEIMSKLIATVLVTLIAIWGNQFLQKKQKADSNIKLYTELLSNKENTENNLRKDMFAKILESFLSPKTSDSKTDPKNIRSGILKIREKRLSLELLARNFHEFLDIKPLFKHVLMEIVRPRAQIKKLSLRLQQLTDDLGAATSAQRRKSACEGLIVISGSLYQPAGEEDAVFDARFCNDTTAPEKFASRMKKDITQVVSDYDRELDELVSIARRVSRKHREILEDVAGKFSLTVPLNATAPGLVCATYSPRDILPQPLGGCRRTEDDELPSFTVPGVAKSAALQFRESDEDNSKTQQRYFVMDVRYVYPKWKQVYVEVSSSPSKEMYNHWLSALRDDSACEKDPGGNLIREDCIDYQKEKYGVETNNFWLEYFDFPLVDNSYIDRKQRYSVILEEFKTDPEETDVSVKIALLYYPASYAGLKEKSFYNNQLMQNLMKQNFFKGVTDNRAWWWF